jgi:hypothetical protein
MNISRIATETLFVVPRSMNAAPAISALHKDNALHELTELEIVEDSEKDHSYRNESTGLERAALMV